IIQPNTNGSHTTVERIVDRLVVDAVHGRVYLKARDELPHFLLLGFWHLGVGRQKVSANCTLRPWFSSRLSLQDIRRLPSSVPAAHSARIFEKFASPPG